MKKFFNPADWRDLDLDIENLTRQIESQSLDITGDYSQWLEIGFALKEALGEGGRQYFHRLSRFYPGYSAAEADRQYDKCLSSGGEGIQPRTLFYFAKQAGIKIKSSLPRQDDASVKSNQPSQDGGVSTQPIQTRDLIQTPARGIEGNEGLRESQPQKPEGSSRQPEGSTQPPEAQMPTFSPQTKGRLPNILEEVAANANSDQDADLLILGSIVALSACLPNVWGIYGDRQVYPNLYLFVAAPASAGKGRLTLCRRLVQPIHKQFKAAYEEQMTKYRKARTDYERRKKRDPTLDPPEEPTRRTLIIPANSSATRVYQILSENGGGGLMFETEGDTLANVFASDYGNYSDGFRKAFHHEPISYTRRKDKEYVELLQPRLSAVLSGTPRQIASLIPDAENGLFSRFIFYCVDFRLEWLNVFEQHGSKGTLDEVFDEIGNRVLKLYRSLTASSGIHFYFTAEEKRDFNEHYARSQLEYYRIFGDDIIASVRRLGLITYRIAMILSVLRMSGESEFPTVLYCHDEDYRTAMTISQVLLRHTARVYRELSSHELYRPAAEGSRRRADLLGKLPDEFGTAEALEASSNMGVSPKSMERYLKQWRDSGLIERTSHGHYRKTSPQTAKPSEPSTGGSTLINPQQNEDTQTHKENENTY